ncbi:MAG: GNAT family N-acetyltransferase [Anaerolineales bacterium]|nr:GNAT family N-acetyltransferase [Anaerolineales bacterium]
MWQTCYEEVILKILPASAFSIEELTHAYNQTRLDYIVPMPLTAARLQEYITVYDVDLDASCAVVDEVEDLIVGIGMLGVREDRTWITRLGVVPYGRRLGAGRALMDYLFDKTRALEVSDLWLEVIAGNEPAHRLFTKMGFLQTRELIVSRRPPSPLEPSPAVEQITHTRVLDTEEIFEHLRNRKLKPNWLNEIETFYHIPSLGGLFVNLQNGCGWVVYESSMIQLKRVIVEVLEGDEAAVTEAILHTLHTRLPLVDAVSENIPSTDPCWAGYEAVGYFDTFRRIEMVRPMHDNGCQVGSGAP